MHFVRTFGWLICVVYSTIPSFWLMVHPRAHRWRARIRSPFRVLLPAWFTMWLGIGVLTGPWRNITIYSTPWSWIPAAALFAVGLFIYSRAGAQFSWTQLGGLPEVRAGHDRHRLITTGIRSRVRHPVYLGHLCEMLAWSIGTGLVVCWLLTAFAIVTGAHDPHGRRRIGEALRKCTCRLSPKCSSRSAPIFMHDSARLSFFADPTPIMKMCHSRSLTRLPRCPFGVFPLFHRLW